MMSRMDIFEQRAAKRIFVIKHHELFDKAMPEYTRDFPRRTNQNENSSAIVKLAREELKYAPRTSAADIFYNLVIVYHSLVPLGKIPGLDADAPQCRHCGCFYDPSHEKTRYYHEEFHEKFERP